MFNLNLNNFNSILELLQAFATEQDCVDYLEKLRRKGTVTSPYAPNSKIYKLKDNWYRCKTIMLL
jgi:hypothetical protein